MPPVSLTTRPLLSLGLPLALVLFAPACSSSKSGGQDTPTPDAAPMNEDASAGDTEASEAGEPDAPLAPGVTAVSLYSCVPNVYTMPVTVGAEQFQLTIDTGSTTMAVASKTCTTCTEANPLYTPGSAAVDEHTTATSQYGTGSWTGEIYEDAVSAGTAPAVPVKFVAIDTQTNFFQAIKCDSKSGGFQGIVGLGQAKSALQGTNAFFDQYVATEHVQDIFALELCDSGGTLWLGGYDPSVTTAAPTYVPMLTTSIVSPYYYTLNLESITVDGTSVPVATGEYNDAVVDTGTSIFVLPTAAFTALTNAVAASPKFTEIFGAGTTASWFASPNNCTSLSQTKAEIDAALPPLTLVFGSNPAITVQANATDSYLVSYEGMWCPALDAMDPSLDFPVAAILGAPVLKSNLVIIDRVNKRVGFAPHKSCP